MNIGVVGLGKLGLPLAVLFSKHFKVHGVDVSDERISQIQKGISFFEPKTNEYLQKHGNNLTVSASYVPLKKCRVVFIITQTPSLPNGKFNLKYVDSALYRLHQVNPECLAVVSSTINIGDMSKLRHIHNRIAYNPEFIKQGSIIHDFENPKFILIGAYTQTDGEAICKVWHRFHKKPCYIINPVEAEITKLTLNVSYTLGITFANVIGEICRGYHADPQKILEVMYQDRRNYKPGLGFAGPCFPRDVECFRQICLEQSFLNAHAMAVFLNHQNNQVIIDNVNRIRELGKKKVGFLGITYKPGVPYLYESQPLKIAQALVKEGFEVYIYDQRGEKNAKEVLNGVNVHFCSSLGECLENAEVLFIGTSNFSKPTVNPWM